MRILGLDLDHQHVKAVEYDSAFGRYDVHEYHETPVPAGEDPLLTAGRLIASLPKKPDRICATLRTSTTTFRNLELPTRNKRAVAVSVGFELDDDLPFSVEDAAYSYTTLQTLGQISHVHVAATLKKNFSEQLDKMRISGIDPDILTTEAWAFRALLNRIFDPASQAQPLLLVHIGHTRTVLYVQHQGKPLAAREISWGGADLSTALSEKLGVPLEQADSLKMDRGLLTSGPADDPASPENRVAAALAEPLQILLRELRQTSLTTKALTDGPGIERILLTGKAALMPGLAQYIEQESHSPTSLLRALSSASTSGVSYAEETDASFALAAASALSLLASEKNVLINLRKGEFSKRSSGEGIQWQSIKGPLLGFSIVSASLILSLMIEGAVYRSQLKEANSRLEKTLKGFFGGQVSASALRTYLSNPKNLKKQIQGEIQKQQSLALLSSPNDRSGLDFLRDLSAATPKDVIVDLTDFQIGAAADQPFVEKAATLAKLTFLVANPQMAERIAAIMATKLDPIERSKMEEITDPEGQKKWKITFTGSPKEATYGR